MLIKKKEKGQMTTSKDFKKRIKIQQISIKKRKGKEKMLFFLPISEVKYFFFNTISILKLGHSTLMCPLIYSDEKIALHTKLCICTRLNL